MELIEAIPRAHEALAEARAGEAARIASAVEEHRIVGLLGEAEVGKTETIRQALASAGVRLVRLDLDAAAGDGHVGFQLVRQIAGARMGETDLSLLTAGALLPQRVEQARIELAEVLGVEGLEEVMREWPSGRISTPAAFACLESFAEQGSVVLWVDHLESPALTPRHPLKLDWLLWGIREIVQRQPGLRVLLSGRSALEGELLGAKAAFHQQGKWLSIDNPAEDAWREVAGRMGVRGSLADELMNPTGGHPPTMLLAFLYVACEPVLRHTHHVLRDLAARDNGLAGRAMQHARSLHRLGGQLMTQLAYGERPYAATQRGESSSQEIRRALDRLRLAGLIRRGKPWTIVNPLVAFRLRGSVRPLTTRT